MSSIDNEPRTGVLAASLPVERLFGGSPVIGPNSHWWESGVVFNTAAVRLPNTAGNRDLISRLLGAEATADTRLADGVVALHYRARPLEDPGYYWPRSFTGLAVCTPEMELLKRFEKPVMGPTDRRDAPDYLGTEDIRITFIDGCFYGLYCGLRFTDDGRWVISLCLARSEDLINWEKLGPLQGGINQDDNVPGCGSDDSFVCNKDGVLFPEKVKGRYVMLHRPMSGERGTHGIHIATCDSLAGVWHNCGMVFAPYSHHSYKQLWVGAGSVPIALGDERFLAISHNGGHLLDGRMQYSLDAMVINLQEFDPTQPAEGQSMVESWVSHIMVPETELEIAAPYPDSVANVVFTCGSYEHDGYIYIPYGAADTFISAARIEKRLLLDVLERESGGIAVVPDEFRSIRRPTCQSLREVGASSHWFSAPFSRIVLNPSMTINNTGASPLKCSQEGALSPLRVNAAYYVGEKPTRIPALWVWQHGSLEDARSAEVVGPEVELTAATAANCSPHGVRAISEDGTLRLTLDPGQTWGEVLLPLTVDLDETPLLMISASEADERWCVKVESDSDERNVLLTEDVRGPASKIVDLPASTGWQGQKSFVVKLFALGEPGSGVTFSAVRCVGRRKPSGLEVTGSEWYPHKTVVRALGGQDCVLQAATILSDIGTVSQVLNVTKAGSGTLTLVGQFPGSASWDSERGTLVLRTDSFSVAMAISRPARWLGAFSTWQCDTPAEPGAANAVWALELNGVKDSDEIVVSALFAPGAREAEAIAARAIESASPRAFHDALWRRECDWNERLSLLPRPGDFSLHAIPPMDTTAADIWHAYYKAWVFVYTNLLEATPETGFAFPQVTAGKPSLWDEGHPICRPSAQWESFIGIHFLAMVDPAAAGECYEGLMSIVDDQGTMAGEGLPARHCRTAWALYEQTGDVERLRSIYPALRRLLVWKLQYPHWIHKRLPDANTKDNEFVTSAILDAEYAKRICEVLDMPEDAEFWRKQISHYGEMFDKWFWGDDGHCYHVCDIATGERSNRTSGVILESLGLPPSVLDPARREALLLRYKSMTRRDLPFMQPGLSKEPTRRMLRGGLELYGTQDELVEMLESEMRDVSRVCEFAEEYTQEATPVCSGVSPSLFGACMLIGSTLSRNGVVPDEGLPVLTRLPDSSGVENMLVKGSPFSIRYAGSDEVVLEGEGLTHLQMPKGFFGASLDGLPHWEGRIAVGERIELRSIACEE